MVVRMVGRSPTGGVGYAPTTMPPQKGGSDFSSVYDLLPAPESLWSVARRLRRAYTGPVIRVRRSSDNVEQDFYGSGASGLVSPEAIRSFNGWNLARNTDDISNASWTKVNVSVSGDQITDDATNAQHYITDAIGISIQSGQIETGSVELKAGTSPWGYLFLDGSFAWFNLATGTIGTVGTGITAAITSVGDGWYRCQITKTRVNAATTFRVGITTSDNVASYAGTGSTIRARRIQFEQASAFSTYEPRTTTGAGSSFLVTRYDQSGNARHATQATTTLQPIVCESGVPVVNSGGRLTSKHVAADARRLAVASSTALYNFLHTTGGTVLAVEQSTASATTKRLLSMQNSTAEGPAFRMGRNSTQKHYVVVQDSTAGTVVLGESVSTYASGENAVSVVQVDADNATAASRVFIWVNGVLTNAVNALSASPSVANAPRNLTIGAFAAGADPHDGTIGDVGIWSVFFTEAERKLVEADQGRFNSITVAP